VHAQCVVVIGAGLAGSEAAFQLARRGIPVRLVDMKPVERSPAHRSADLAELVCSNSLPASGLGHAVGLLKEELRRLGSLVLEAADATAVPAGRALAVDRVAFARHVTERVEAARGIERVAARVDRLPGPADAPLAIVATGPLTAPALAADLERAVGPALAFYDAISPIVYADSVDPGVGFRASRWEDGEGDYLNLPLERAEYERFVAELVGADPVPLHACEAKLYFEGCLPIEEMARRGRETLAFGPMKPAGLRHPQTGLRPAAVVQLRREDERGALYNLVGFQTRLRIPDQQRILRGLPGLGGAVFARYGSVHRNTYVNAPACLGPTLELRGRPGLYLAGQLAGVEGYVESAALGLLAGLFAAAAFRGEAPAVPPPTTACGALLRHLREGDPRRFQPMNANFGLFEPLVPAPRDRRERHRALAARALDELERYRTGVAA
jgi:methylenetetrahydrofolate--tRNA-(uracil-5-)-methyltransferase